MLTPENVQKVIEILDRTFPDPKPPLNFSSPFELLVSVVLAAQCTDERVNKVTPSLFPAYNTPQKVLDLGFERLRDIIYSCGYHNQKAKNLIACSKVLVDQYGGNVPSTLEELTALPGVGRKSASVILSQSFGIPAFPVDTHVFRVTNRIGIMHEKTVEKTADALEQKIPRDRWIPFHLQLIFHGQKTCKAPRPRCWECPVKHLCEYPYKTLAPKQKAKNT
jgi:endonuclease-3